MIKQLFIHSSHYFVSLVGAKIFSTIVFLLLARNLQPELFGTFTYFLTLLSLTTLVGDFGLIQWYQKTVATNLDAHTTLIHLFEARFITLLISMLGVSVFFILLSPFNNFISVLFIATLVPESLISVFDGYYLFKKESPKLALKQFSKLIFIPLYFVYTGSEVNLASLILLYSLSSFATLVWFVPWKKIWREIVITHHSVKTLAASKNYGLLLITSAVYSRGDTIVIDQVAGRLGVGIYSAAYRYLEVVNLLPSALAQNLFHLSATPNLLRAESLKKIVAIMGVVGVAVSVVLFLSAELLTITLLGPSYAQSAQVLRILSGAVFFFFINAPLSTVVQSSNQLTSFLPWGMANTMLNIIANLILIPQYGILVAAWVMMGTEITGLLINVYFVRKHYLQTS